MIKSEVIRDVLSNVFEKRHQVDQGRADAGKLETIYSDTLYQLGKRGGSIFRFKLTIKAVKKIEENKVVDFPVYLPLLEIYNGRNLKSNKTQKIQIVRYDTENDEIFLNKPPMDKNLDAYVKTDDGKIAFKLKKYDFPIKIRKTIQEDDKFKITITFHIENYAPDPRSWLSKLFKFFYNSHDIFWFFGFDKSNSDKVANLEFKHPERSKFKLKNVSIYDGDNEEWEEKKGEWAEFDHNLWGKLVVEKGKRKKVFIRSRCSYFPEWTVLLGGIIIYTFISTVISMLDPISPVFLIKIIPLTVWTFLFSFITMIVLKKYLI